MLKTWIRDNISPEDFITSSGQLPFDPTCAAKGPNTGVSETRRRRNFEANEPDGNLGGQRAFFGGVQIGKFSGDSKRQAKFCKVGVFCPANYAPTQFTGLDCFGYFKRESSAVSLIIYPIPHQC